VKAGIMSTGEQDATMWSRNSFGWCVHKWEHGYKIMHFHSHLYKSLILSGPVILGMLLIKLKNGNFFHADSIMLILILLLISFWVLRPWVFYVDREKEHLKIGILRIPFSQLMLLITYTKDKRHYMLHGRNKKWASLFPLLWESADKSEVIRIMETIFGGCVLKEDIEGTGLFSYKQKVGSTVYVNTLERIERNKKRKKDSFKFRCLSLPASSHAKDFPASVEKH
jgi:hypothetical protein